MPNLLTMEEKETLKLLRRMKESSSFIALCFFDESLQKEMGFSDSYYISEDSDMESSLLNAKIFKTKEEAYAFKSGLNIKVVQLALMADYEIEMLKEKNKQ